MDDKVINLLLGFFASFFVFIIALIKMHHVHREELRLERQRTFDMGREWGMWKLSYETHRALGGERNLQIAALHLKHAVDVKVSAQRDGIKVY